MTITLFSSDGTKKGTLELPASIFEAPIKRGLMHQAVVRLQSNRRAPVAHAKTRAEVEGSTRKLYAQKGTGRARRGSVRSPLLRGGGKAFGPRKARNFQKDMPRAMRRAALLSSLSLQAKQGRIIGLESYPETIKTKPFAALLKKLSIDLGRRTLIVLAADHKALESSSRNIPGVRTTTLSSLNPLDVLQSRHVIFLRDAVAKAEELFGKTQKTKRTKKTKTKSSFSSESSLSS
jgi:large subunit ribosomal protein L4